MAQFIDDTISGQNDDSDTADWPGGRGAFLAQGTFSGITLTLQFQVDGSSLSTVVSPAANNVVLTANGMGVFELCPCKLRVEGTGGSSGFPPTAVKVRVAPSWNGFFPDGTLL